MLQVGDFRGESLGRGRWARSAQGAEAEAEAHGDPAAEADRIGDVVTGHPDELGPDVRTDEEQAVLTAVALADGHREGATDHGHAAEDLRLERVDEAGALGVAGVEAEVDRAVVDLPEVLATGGPVAGHAVRAVEAEGGLAEGVGPEALAVDADVDAGSATAEDGVAGDLAVVTDGFAGHHVARDVPLEEGAVAGGGEGGELGVEGVVLGRVGGADGAGRVALGGVGLVLDPAVGVGAGRGLEDEGVVLGRETGLEGLDAPAVVVDDAVAQVVVGLDRGEGRVVAGVGGQAGLGLGRHQGGGDREGLLLPGGLGRAGVAAGAGAAAEVARVVDRDDLPDPVRPEGLRGAQEDVAEDVGLGRGVLDDHRPGDVVQLALRRGRLAAVVLGDEGQGVLRPRVLQVAGGHGVGDRVHGVGAGAVVVDPVAHDLGEAGADGRVPVVAVVGRGPDADVGGVLLAVGVDVDGRREGAVLVRVDGGGVGGRGERAGDETHQGQGEDGTLHDDLRGWGVTGRFQAGPVGG